VGQSLKERTYPSQVLGWNVPAGTFRPSRR